MTQTCIKFHKLTVSDQSSIYSIFLGVACTVFSAGLTFVPERSMLLTPAPQLALGGHEETVCSTGTGHHTANLDIIQTAVAVRTPQILAQVAESSCKQVVDTSKLDDIHFIYTPNYNKSIPVYTFKISFNTLFKLVVSLRDR